MGCLLQPRQVMSLSSPIIVCAANRHHDTGLIVCGARHYDSVMRRVINSLTPDRLLDRLRPSVRTWDQGFIDQHGQWYTRTEAWVIAQANGQVKRRVGGDTADGGTLYSESIY